MNPSKKKWGEEDDTRSLLKNLHKKVYSICRLFTNNYKEHQTLFAGIMAAAVQSIRVNKAREDKQTLFYRACLNICALHAISRNLDPAMDRSVQFKSPDYQKCMEKFRESAAGLGDFERFLLFLELEKCPADKTEDLTGLSHTRPKSGKQHPSRPFTPPLNQGLRWI